MANPLDILIEPDRYNSRLILIASIIFWAPGLLLVWFLDHTPLSSRVGGKGGLVIVFWANVLCLPLTIGLILPCLAVGLIIHWLREKLDGPEKD
jgi:hypothetical protein